MKNFETTQSTFDDHDLDRLLEEFFRQEMPAALQQLPDVPESLHAPVASLPPTRTAYVPLPSRPLRRNRASRAGTFVLLTVAGCLLIAMAALWSASMHAPSDNVAGTLRVPSADAPHEAPTTPSTEPAADGTRNVPATVSVNEFEERLEPLERLTYDTANGPVEQRTNLRWTNVSVYEPESGSKVEMLIPELSIEIFEIEDRPNNAADSAEKTPGPRNSLPEAEKDR